ncbi:MAG: hypothetical protein HRU19_29650 [Pseudobacteriovorax sp.]|nr:hypothetical protein [Pseudobacteriovorax sp.]
MSKGESFIIQKPEIEAEIYYLTEEEGGRKNPVFSGYRRQFYYDGNDFDAPQQFLDSDICQPGDSIRVVMQTFSPESHSGKLWVGKEFEVREGSKTVGRGKILRIFNDLFNFWDHKSFKKDVDSEFSPYSTDALLTIRSDIDLMLREVHGVDANIDFEETGNPECLLLVKAKFSARSLSLSELIECWKVVMIDSNQLYKINWKTTWSERNSRLIWQEVTLDFATWHERSYLTGRIIIDR